MSTSTAVESGNDRVLRVLRANPDGITAHHYEFGKGFRLAARIKDLREDGFVIETKKRPDKVCVYRLKPETPF